MNRSEVKFEGRAIEEAVSNVHSGTANVQGCGNCEPPEMEGQRQTSTNEEMYITRWKLHAISLGLLVALFIVQMESSITSTTVLDITDDLGGYDHSSWLFTSYLMTYCGLQIVWAKISDNLSRKLSLLISLFIVTLFSGLCGASQTLMQLIHFRWLQGIDGSGVFSLVQLVFFELEPPRKWPAYISLVTGVIALYVISGPLLGGVIASKGGWRWIFLMNVPIGALSGTALFLIFPRRLWNESMAQTEDATSQRISFFHHLRRVDVLGSLLLLGSCIFVATGLQQAAVGQPWKSPMVLVLLICAAPLAVAFFVWQLHVTTHQSSIEPIFPWRFCQSRIRIGMIINTYLAGTILSVYVVQIPQRFATVYGLSPVAAAIKLLSFGVFVPVGSSFAAVLMGKARMPPCWIILAGAILQTIGLVLLSQLPYSGTIDPAQYSYQVITGIGVGCVNAALTLLVPYAMEKRDLATGTSVIAQFRLLGRLVGISIASAISTPYIRSHMLDTLPHPMAVSILEKVETLEMVTGWMLDKARVIFDNGYGLQTRLLIGFAVAQFPATMLMWTNPGQRVVKSGG